MKKATMIFSMLLMTSLGLSACANKTAVIGGVNDLVPMPKGSKINNVPLPTDENKSYTIVTPKDGFWISKQGWNRVIKATTGSNPQEDKENK